MQNKKQETRNEFIWCYMGETSRGRFIRRGPLLEEVRYVDLSFFVPGQLISGHEIISGEE